MIETITVHLALIESKARLRGDAITGRADPAADAIDHINRALGDTRGAIDETITGLADPAAAMHARHALEGLERALGAIMSTPARTIDVSGIRAILARRDAARADRTRNLAILVHATGGAAA